MASFTEGDVLPRDVRLHYYRDSGGARPLIFAHGLTDSGLCWTPIAEQLRGQYDLIMYDARGHGLSDRAPADAYSFDALADDLAGLVRELGLHQPIVLGHSLGSATAALAAARSPGLFGALLLEDPPGQLASPDGAADQATLERWRSDLIADQQLSAEQLIAKERARSPKWSDAELEPWADAKPRVDPNALCVITNPASEWHELVEQIDCPLLLITGDPAAGAIITQAFADELAGRWQRGQVAHIPGAGHCIRRDQPERYMQAVSQFLGSL